MMGKDIQQKFFVKVHSKLVIILYLTRISYEFSIREFMLKQEIDFALNE